MISWIQRNFQHHFRIIFALVLIGTIVSFIVTIGATSSIGYGSRRVTEENFFGRNLASQSEQQRIFDDGRLSLELQYGYAESEDQIKQYALDRIAALHLADELHLPAADPDEIADRIRHLRIFAGANGEFDAGRYNAFRQSLDDQGPFSQSAVLRVIAEDARVTRVQELLDGPGYILDADVKRQMTASETAWTIDTATIEYADFHPSIEATDLEAEKFFAENSFRYQIPPQTLASYVDFPAASYEAGVVPTESEIEAYFAANRQRFAAPAAAPKGRPPAPPTLDLVRPQVVAALKAERARQQALDAASDFAVALYEERVANGPALEAFAAARKLAIRPLPPFPQGAAPKELGGSADVADAASKIGPDRYFSDALATPDGAAVLLWRGSQPARQPAFAEVEDKVRADYLEEQRRQRFADLGRELRSRISRLMGAGDAFARAAAAAGAESSVKIAVKALPAFTLGAAPKDLDPEVEGDLGRLGKGQLSEMAINGGHGLLVYVADKRVPQLSETDPRFAQARVMISAYSARLASAAFLSQMVQQELKRAEPAVK